MLYSTSKHFTRLSEGLGPSIYRKTTEPRPDIQFFNTYHSARSTQQTNFFEQEKCKAIWLYKICKISYFMMERGSIDVFC